MFDILRSMVVEKLRSSLVEKEAHILALRRDNERLANRTWEIQKHAERIVSEVEHQLNRDGTHGTGVSVERMNLDNIRAWAREIRGICDGRL